MIKKRLSDKMKSSRATRLKARALKIDKNDRLDSYHIEYYYGDDVDFVKMILNPDNCPVMAMFFEAEDNSEDGHPPMLIFSRPNGPIFCVVRDFAGIKITHKIPGYIYLPVLGIFVAPLVNVVEYV